MCGLFGWSWKRAPKREQCLILASVLASEMDARGGDSWGFHSPHEEETRRGTGRLSQSLGAESFAGCKAIIGHTRKATTGKICADNAHPFTLNTIVGAHNGIVSNHQTLNRLYRRSCAVDSMHIFHHLEEGADTREIEAYGAITYTTMENSAAVQLAYFNGGELAIAEIPSRGIVWASMSRALGKALCLAGLEHGAEEFNTREERVYIAERGRLSTSKTRLRFADPWKDNTFRGWEGGGKSKDAAPSYQDASTTDLDLLAEMEWMDRKEDDYGNGAELF